MGKPKVEPKVEPKVDQKKKISLGDLRKWIDANMETVLGFHAYSIDLKKSRETATVESAVRGIGQDMERLKGALQKLSSATGKKEEETTAFSSPRRR